MKKLSIIIILAIILNLYAENLVYAHSIEPSFKFFKDSIINMTKETGFTVEDINNYLKDYKNYALFMRDAL